MKKAKNQNNLSQEDIFKLYEYLTLFESNIKEYCGTFNFSDTRIQDFQDKANLVLRAYTANRYILGSSVKQNKYYLIFEAKKPKKEEYNDIAFHLLRHLRNSIAHALIRKKGKNFFLEDKNSNGSITCQGNIRRDLFYELINKIIETKSYVNT
ncbi:MAG: hypothetical protein ACLTSL_09520 [Odoribacter splanchnicus]